MAPPAFQALGGLILKEGWQTALIKSIDPPLPCPAEAVTVWLKVPLLRRASHS